MELIGGFKMNSFYGMTQGQYTQAHNDAMAQMHTLSISNQMALRRMHNLEVIRRALAMPEPERQAFFDSLN